MRIAHLCLSNFYVDNCAYQENQLVAQHVRDNHEVIVIASTEVIDANGFLSYTASREYFGSDGARVFRVPYRFNCLGKISKKIRIYKGTNDILEKFKPNAIMFHGTCALELLVVRRFIKKNPDVLFYVDSHEDFNNSARTFWSKWLLHWFIYRLTLLYVLPNIRKILCVSQETIYFQSNFYGIHSECLELFPLGGDIYEDWDYEKLRNQERVNRNISDDTCLLVQTGKIDSAKKLTNTLRALSQIPGDRVRLLVAGKLMPDVEEEVGLLLAADPRVSFIGWTSPGQLKALLCAADVYVQPGSQSATMQMSLCCRCAVVLDDVPSHHMYHDGNGYLVKNDTQLEAALLKMAHASRNELIAMSNRSRDVAAKWLDYKQLAQRIVA
jgi:1,2-diacylglycerol 3-alpha-glucosyltransferase